MTKRFVRSVIRVFVVFNVEMSPAALGNKKRALQSATQPLMRCKRAFQVRCEQPFETSLSIGQAIHDNIWVDRANFNDLQIRRTISPTTLLCSPQGLITIAVEELCETANALLAPVRLGVARPTAPFALSSSANSDAASIEELFSAEPVAPRLNAAGAAGGSGRDNRYAIQ